MHRQAGFTLPEALLLVALVGVASMVTIQNLRPAEQPLHAGGAVLEGTLRQARLQAIANTAAFRVSPDSSKALEIQTAASCGATSWSAVPNGTFELPAGVTLTSTTWKVCFTSRGVSTDNTVITLSHHHYGTRQVEVLIGGTTRVL